MGHQELTRFKRVELAVPGGDAASTEKLRSKRGLGKLRKPPLSGRTSGGQGTGESSGEKAALDQA